MNILESTWAYLNPYENESIEKKVLCTFMRILISNLNRQNESDLANKLAALILNNWDESGIPIRQLVENS